MHSSKQYVISQEKSLSGKGFLEDGTEIDDDETFKVCANDIFVFSCDGTQCCQVSHKLVRVFFSLQRHLY